MSSKMMMSKINKIKGIIVPPCKVLIVSILPLHMTELNPLAVIFTEQDLLTSCYGTPRLFLYEAVDHPLVIGGYCFVLCPPLLLESCPIHPASCRGRGILGLSVNWCEAEAETNNYSALKANILKPSFFIHSSSSKKIIRIIARPQPPPPIYSIDIRDQTGVLMCGKYFIVNRTFQLCECSWSIYFPF